MFINFIGCDIITRFKLCDAILINKGFTPEFLALHRTWRYLGNPSETEVENALTQLDTEFKNEPENLNENNSNSEVDSITMTEPSKDGEQILKIEGLVNLANNNNYLEEEREKHTTKTDDSHDANLPDENLIKNCQNKNQKRPENYGLAIIFTSDSIMVKCEKLLNSAYHQQLQALEMSLLRVELKRFIVKLKHFKPVISAADFFEIKRITILNLIIGITTYSIIMLQLGDTKFKDNLKVKLSSKP
ncbi:unnamed protein product [Psylliodes chrysocephalus]|uniref:Gustatory receptor n=1 Tax=Psylliodes chrysocephalus TaxID=3402493 RepID=A0A9P0GKM7_9CUCU|nr:unnamed protein product [Psylliodes chrysocephala]